MLCAVAVKKCGLLQFDATAPFYIPFFIQLQQEPCPLQE